VAEITVGKKAPAFTLPGSRGKKVSLSKDLLGGWSVLYFYPKDMTPGCTKEACSFRDNFAALKKRGVKVYGVSPDGVESHQKFTAKHELNFELLADTDHAVAARYGAWGEKKMYGKTFQGIKRMTFLIDPQGRIQHIWAKPKTEIHAEEVLAKLDELDV
jgi:peroxiredoxin Q/BCP